MNDGVVPGRYTIGAYEPGVFTKGLKPAVLVKLFGHAWRAEFSAQGLKSLEEGGPIGGSGGDVDIAGVWGGPIGFIEACDVPG